MKFISLFAGIGGFDLGLERAGMECIGQVEYNPFCQRILKHHWPSVKLIGDIHDVTGDSFGSADLICGGFPCQPFSTAGKRKGKNDNRYLWPEMLRVIQAYRPPWVLGENVAGIKSVFNYEVFSEMEGKEYYSKEEAETCFKGVPEREGENILDLLLGDLERIGYKVQPFIVPACAVNAPHQRNRVWIVAYNSKQNSDRTENGLSEQTDCDAPDSNSKGLPIDVCGKFKSVSSQVETQKRGEFGGTYTEGEWREEWYEVAALLCRVDDGISDRMDRIKALGNAVVPQVVEVIGRAIMATERAASMQQEVCAKKEN